MSEQQKCKNCGFIGYPEIVRRESFFKNLLMWLSDKDNKTNRYLFNRNISYQKWDQFSAKKNLRCPKCKQTNCMIPIEDNSYKD